MKASGSTMLSTIKSTTCRTNIVLGPRPVRSGGSTANLTRPLPQPLMIARPRLMCLYANRTASP
jgi:hypothetical protein